MGHQRTTYTKELARLKKGVAIAWWINFLTLFLTIEAAIVLIAYDRDMKIGSFLLFSSLVSLVIAALSVSIISMRSSRIMMGAAGKNLKRVESGVVYNVVNEMAIASRVPVPEVYIAINSGVANAYVVADKKTSRLVITDGLLSLLTRTELQGVVAHEIGHLSSGDSQEMTKLTAMTSTTALIAGTMTRMGGGRRGRSNNSSSSNNNGILELILLVVSLLFLIAAPFLAKIAESFASRERESEADALSVKYTRNPSALANALYKLSDNDKKIDQQAATAFGRKAGEVAFYAPHFKGASTFATHPPLEQRIETLEKMGATINKEDSPTLTMKSRIETSEPASSRPSLKRGIPHRFR